MRTRITLLLVSLTLVGVIAGWDGVATARAQQGGVAYPDPSECQIAPRSDADIAALLATPDAATASPAATPSASPIPATALPTGEAARPDALFGINATLRELVACMNAGETARALALVTDAVGANELHLLFGTTQISLGTPTPVAENERTPFLSIRDPRVVADGKVGAIVSNPVNPAEAYFIVFEQHEGRWLIVSIAKTEAAGVGGP
jgi:hypothetical protein